MIRRISKLTALSLVAFIAGIAVLVGTPTTAQAAVATQDAYRQTLPASVLDTIPPAERSRWIDGTRAGNVGTGGSIVPIRSTPGPRVGLLGGGASLGLMVGGQLIQDASPATAGEWWRDSSCSPFDLAGCKEAERPSHIDEDEWAECGSGGSDVFGTLNDWAQWLLGAGTDCNDVRAGWEQPRSADYDLSNPIGAAPSSFPTTLPMRTAYYRNADVHFAAPVWDSRTNPSATAGGSEVGYVYPVNITYGPDGQSGSGGFYVYARQVTTAGHAGTQNAIYVTGNTATPANSAPLPWPAACEGFQMCLAPNRWGGAAELAQPGTMSYQLTRMWGQFYSPREVGVPSLPAQPARGGQTPGTGLEEVNLVTTITTESGSTYTCHTRGFVESATYIPQPCTPTWADPDEVITERIVEVVPVRENPTHVPYSNPSREVERTTVPQPVRDQQRENSECSKSTCYVEVMVQRPDGVWVACSKYPELCRDWKRTTDTKPASHPFRCEYNGKIVSLSECRHLARIFEPGAIESGTAYPDPEKEGQPNNDPAANPGHQTSTSPSPAVAPGQPVRDPSTQRQCFPTGWGVLNPVEWVYRPIMCALEDAFVPRPIKLDQLRQAAVMPPDKLPMVLMSAIAGLHFEGPGSGCNGIPVALSQVNANFPDFRIGDACSMPASQIANVTHTILSISVVIGAMISISRSVAGIVQYNAVSGAS